MRIGFLFIPYKPYGKATLLDSYCWRSSLNAAFATPVADFYAERCYPVISAGLSICESVVPFSLEEVVVIDDIPAGVLAAGTPCRVIRRITSEDRSRYIR